MKLPKELRLVVQSSFAFSVSILLSGCLVVPLNITSPYPADRLQMLSQPKTDRDAVRNLLGSPTAIKSGGEYWFYTNSRHSWGVIGLGSRPLEFSDNEWVGIRFDKAGFVGFLEFSDSIPGCLTNGICLSLTFLNSVYNPVISSPETEDAAAKIYQAGANECAIYLFSEAAMLTGLTPATFSIDGKLQSTINGNTYIFLTHPIGAVNISVYDLKLSFNCKGEEKLYIKAVKGFEASWKKGQDLVLIGTQEGEAEIRKRKLVLPD